MILGRWSRQGEAAPKHLEKSSLFLPGFAVRKNELEESRQIIMALP